MIKDTELRKGNLLYVDKETITEVTVIGEDYLGTTKTIGFINIEKFNPIPLTPEILEKWCGLGNGSEIKCDYHDMAIEIVHNEIWLSTDDFRQVKLIEWLHQFQNIYIDLTDEELEIKL